MSEVEAVGPRSDEQVAEDRRRDKDNLRVRLNTMRAALEEGWVDAEVGRSLGHAGTLESKIEGDELYVLIRSDNCHVTRAIDPKGLPAGADAKAIVQLLDAEVEAMLSDLRGLLGIAGRQEQLRREAIAEAEARAKGSDQVFAKLPQPLRAIAVGISSANDALTEGEVINMAESVADNLAPQRTNRVTDESVQALTRALNAGRERMAEIFSDGPAAAPPLVFSEESRDRVGDLPVDSGMLLVIDPCYLDLLDFSDRVSLIPEGEHVARLGLSTPAGPRALGVVFRTPGGDGHFPVRLLESGARDPENPGARDVVGLSIDLSRESESGQIEATEVTASHTSEEAA